MKKLTLAQVKALIKKQGNVKIWLCPSNCAPNPRSPFNCAALYDSSLFTFARFTERIPHLERTVNQFTYYNCDTERGRRVHYYIEEMSA